MRALEVIRTEDGSSSLYLPELDETYHSHHGALTESKHVFIRMGLEYFLSEQQLPRQQVREAQEIQRGSVQPQVSQGKAGKESKDALEGRERQQEKEVPDGGQDQEVPETGEKQQGQGARDIKSLKVFEVGFGTGLNALLACEVALKKGIQIHYTTLEPFPLAEETVNALKYGELLEGDIYQKIFLQMHKVAWGEPQDINEQFRLLKYQQRLEDFTAPATAYDLVFFDAFAPSKQAELWEKPLLEKVAAAMAPGAVFTTYCAKGQLKRDLKAIGLQLETLPGAPGKKEMVRARKV